MECFGQFGLFIYLCGILIHLERCLCLFAFSIKSHVCLLIALDLSSSPTGGEKRCLLWKWEFLRLLHIAMFLGRALFALVGVDGLLVRCPNRASSLWLARCCFFANTSQQVFIYFLQIKMCKNLTLLKVSEVIISIMCYNRGLSNSLWWISSRNSYSGINRDKHKIM